MNIKGLSYTDWALYYNGAILRNPVTGNPAYVTGIGCKYDERRDVQRRDDPPQFVDVADITGDIDGALDYQMHRFEAEDVQAYLSDTKVFELNHKLGYRTFSEGKVAVMLRKVPGGARRALTQAKIKVVQDRYLSRLFYRTEYLKYDGLVDQFKYLISAIFNPKYTGITEGLEKVKAGEIISFSPNPDILVRPSACVGVGMEAVFRDSRVLVHYKGENLLPTYLGDQATIEPLLAKEA